MERMNGNKCARRIIKIHHWEIIALGLIGYDVVAISFSWFFGLWMRFDFMYSEIPKEYLFSYVKFLPFYLLCVILLFWFMRMYRGIWRFAGFHELVRYGGVTLLASVIHWVGITVFCQRMPFSYYFVGAVLQEILVPGIRFSYRFYNEVFRKTADTGEKDPSLKVMIIGAGAAGRSVIRELQHTDRIRVVPCCIIDDNSNKWGRFIEGVPVVGGRRDIPSSVLKYDVDQIYFCIPTATAKQRKDILNICKETGCGMKSLPGIYQLASDEVLVSRLKPVAIEDLLGREQITVNMDEIFRHIRGRTILVTGGGGSIGSELCRQIAGHAPKQLIIFDIYENTTYKAELELREKYPDLNLVVLIGSVRDSRRINQVFEQYRPDIVYHAAAHKHVPLMEYSPNEAIKNNVIGTYKTAYAALKYGTKRFVLISTDKAVNPTNIMGASKRLCEMIIQSMDAVGKSGRLDMLPFIHSHKDSTPDDPGYQDPMDHIAADWTKRDISKPKRDPSEAKRDTSKPKRDSSKAKPERSVKGGQTGTQFVAVRFGNVLGSNGSVIPRFREQIEAGGPVTVTHPDIIRYFMTIPEAVSLVLQAGTYAQGGEIFVLDMGEPVKIDTLARNLIQLSGYRPGEDIEIVYTGLRPGEKLFEEKLMAEEGIQKTENKLIYIGKPIPFDVETILKQLEELAAASYENSPDIVKMVEKIVPTFHPMDEKLMGTGSPSEPCGYAQAAATEEVPDDPQAVAAEEVSVVSQAVAAEEVSIVSQTVAAEDIQGEL